jgi:NADPH:quinone reductase-like Zn-dependent oxidoreductase
MAIDGFGGPEKLGVVDRPRPKPAPHQLLVRTVAAGVNPVDWKIREGRTAVRHAFPLIPGFDVAGVVDELGERTSRFRKGDRVWALAWPQVVQWGCYAEYVAVDEDAVGLMPTKLLYEEAAAVPLAGLTAWQALSEHGDIGSGGSVLVQGGAGGVGHFAVQLARNAGAEVLATAGTGNQAFLAELGAAVSIDYTRDDVRQAVRRHRPDGVDLAIDTVGPETAGDALELVRPGGCLVCIAGAPTHGANDTRVRVRQLRVRPGAGGLDRLRAFVDRGRLGPHVSRIYPLREAAAAQQQSAEGHVRGKLVLNL